MSDSTSHAAPVRAVRAILVAAVLLEALVCAGYGVFLGIEAVVADAADPVAALVMALLAIVLGGALRAVAKVARRGRHAARVPVLVWQVMQSSVAYLTFGTSWAPFGVLLVLLAGIAGVGSLWPGVLGGDAPTGGPTVDDCPDKETG